MDWRDNLARIVQTDPTKQIGFYCSCCKQTFACEARDFDNTCLLCGAGAGQKPNDLPRKLPTGSQRRASARAAAKAKATPPEGHVYGECVIKL